MSAEALRASKKDFYTAADVAPLLHWDPQYIRVVARDAPEQLPFEVLVHGTRTQILPAAFWAWWDANVKPERRDDE